MVASLLQVIAARLVADKEKADAARLVREAERAAAKRLKIQRWGEQNGMC